VTALVEATYVCRVAVQIYTYAVGLDLSDVCTTLEMSYERLPLVDLPNSLLGSEEEIYCDNIGRDACGVA
jgi:hypothetical protein